MEQCFVAVMTAVIGLKNQRPKPNPREMAERLLEAAIELESRLIEWKDAPPKTKFLRQFEEAKNLVAEATQLIRGE